MATQIVDFNGLKSDNEEVLTEESLKEKIENLTEEDEDGDSVILNMSDISDSSSRCSADFDISISCCFNVCVSFNECFCKCFFFVALF